MIYALLVAAVLIVFVIGVYNGLISLRNQCDKGWANIDTQLKRRYDLIPNLVETVKGYAKHEAETLEGVVKARTAAMGATTVADKQKAENALSSTLKSIFALSEKYPDLKANQNFMDLQETLRGTEDQIQSSRSVYNELVRAFNTKLQVFPNNLLANMLGFLKRDFFEIDEKEKENIKVSF